MANNNKTLAKANRNKKDEFYTRLEDITRELSHYKEHFKGKVVLCNCDDPYESNFFKYFANLFNVLGLKKLIATSYKGSPVVGREMDMFAEEDDKWNKITSKKAHRVVIAELKQGDTFVNNPADIKEIVKHRVRYLKGDGDFRSPECIELLKEADIVVSNPPFSLFREYVAQLIEYNKKFIIIGNQNAITYKDIFSLIMENKIWLGYGFPGNVGFFKSPYEDTAASSQHKEGTIRVSGVTWFTNLDIKKRHEKMVLYRKYDPEDYPTYDNYDAIEVSKTANIPYDYDGMMGVPITFMDKYNPEQFKLLGITQRNDDPFKIKKYTKEEYANANDLNARAVLIKDGIPRSIYARILIKKV